MYFSENGSVGALDVDFSRIADERNRLICLLVSSGMKTKDIISITKKDIRKISLVLSDDIVSLLNYFSKDIRDHDYIFSSGRCLSSRRVQQIVMEETGRSISEIRRFHKQSLDPYLTLDDLNLLKRNLSSQRDLLIFNILLETGITLGQVLNLKKHDVMYEQIRIPDTDSRFSYEDRSCKISLELYSSLISYIDSDSYIFTNNKGNKMSSRRVQQAFSEYSDIIGKRVTPRTIRNASKMVYKVPSSDIAYSSGDHLPITDGGRYEIT